MFKEVKELMEQINKADFKDENGMCLKNNQAYLEVEEEIKRIEIHDKEMVNEFEITTNLLGNKRIDRVKSCFNTFQLANCVDTAKEEDEFVVLVNVDNVEIAVRARNVESITRLK